MNYFSKDSLTSVLKNKTNFLELKSNEASVIISEHGGRVLGIFPKVGCTNLLWVDHNIQKLDLKTVWNIGGDRYWISPERTFFYKDPETWTGWFCPPGLDPANFKIKSSNDIDHTLSTDISLKNQLIKESYDGKLKRHISLVEEPIKTGLPYCGIQFIEECSFTSPYLQINGWSLTQVISGGVENPGTVLIPTNPNPETLSYIRLIPEERLEVGENYIAFKIDVDDVYKLAVRPEDIDFSRAAKIGYTLKIPDSNDYGFVVKISDDIPKNQDDCFDISRDHPDSEIGVIQSYNSESLKKPDLMFGEIEVQLSPFKTVDNKSQSKVKHQLFGYICSSKEEILHVIEEYLGITNPKLF